MSKSNLVGDIWLTTGADGQVGSATSWPAHGISCCSTSLSFHQESITWVIILWSGRPEHPPRQQQQLHLIAHWDQSTKATSENLLSPLTPLDNPTQLVLQEAFPHKIFPWSGMIQKKILFVCLLVCFLLMKHIYYNFLSIYHTSSLS